MSKMTQKKVSDDSITSLEFLTNQDYKSSSLAVHVNSRFTIFNTTLSQKVLCFLVQLLYARLEGKKLRQRTKNTVRILLVVAI